MKKCLNRTRMQTAVDMMLADPKVTGKQIAAALGVTAQTGCEYRQRALNMISSVRRNDIRVAAERAAAERDAVAERRKAERRAPQPVLTSGGLVMPVLRRMT